MRMVLALSANRGCIEFFLELNDVQLNEWCKLNNKMHQEARDAAKS